MALKVSFPSSFLSLVADHDLRWWPSLCEMTLMIFMCKVCLNIIISSAQHISALERTLERTLDRTLEKTLPESIPLYAGRPFLTSSTPPYMKYCCYSSFLRCEHSGEAHPPDAHAGVNIAKTVNIVNIVSTVNIANISIQVKRTRIILKTLIRRYTQLRLLSTETSKKILQGILLTSSRYPILQISNYHGIPTSSAYPILQFVQLSKLSKYSNTFQKGSNPLYGI